MKTITLQEALSAGACYNAEQIIDLFGDRTELSVKDIAALEIPDADKVWAFTRPHFLDTKEKVIRFAVFCAEQCVEIFEAQRPDDKRPQAAIEAAKAWLESPSDESVEAAANAAAWAVRDAAMRAYWAAAWAVRDAASAAAWDAVVMEWDPEFSKEDTFGDSEEESDQVVSDSEMAEEIAKCMKLMRVLYM